MSHIYIATPVYGGIQTVHSIAIQRGIKALESAGHTVTWIFREGCCYVHTARNQLVRGFLASDADELLFIDSDIGFLPNELVKLCSYEEPLVGAAAPFRTGAAGFPVHAVIVDGHVLRMAPHGLIMVKVLATAMMRIRREVFTKLIAAGKAPRLIERLPTDPNETAEELLSFFDFETEARPERGDDVFVEYGEDVTFCRKWISIGGEIWIDPTMTLQHSGRSVYQGNYLNYLELLHAENEKQNKIFEAESPPTSSAA